VRSNMDVLFLYDGRRIAVDAVQGMCHVLCSERLTQVSDEHQLGVIAVTAE